MGLTATFEDESETTTGIGIGAFFDATYAEIGLGLNFFNDDDTDTTYFSLSVLGKYPFDIGQKLTLFPLIGFDWNLFMSAKFGDEEIKRADFEDDADELDMFIINFGLGADYALTDKLYLRGSLLYGIKVNSKSEQEIVDDGGKVFTGGPTFKVAVGYRF
jgi:lipopolysaccharide assembly outer membrane protein LptD (OstA)